MAEPIDGDDLRRLRLALLREIVTAAERLEAPAAMPGCTPAERLALAVGTEIEKWMARRGKTHRTVGACRSTLARALGGHSITTTSIAAIAAALGCEPIITFRPLAGLTYEANGATSEATACDTPPETRRLDPDASTTVRISADAPAGATKD